MSGTNRHTVVDSSRSDLQEIIAAKISLREEIKTELRAEFSAQIDGVKTSSFERHEFNRKLLADLKDDIDRREKEAFVRQEQRFQAQQLGLTDALAAADRAVSKAETAQEKRLDSVNEFRETLRDQQGTFLPRAEADARFTSVLDKCELLRASSSIVQLDLKQVMAESGGKQHVWAVVGGAALSIAALLIALYSSMHNAQSSGNPTVGVDTKRVDDLIAVMTSQQNATNSRLDALSARLNIQGQPSQLTAPTIVSPAVIPVQPK